MRPRDVRTKLKQHYADAEKRKKYQDVLTDAAAPNPHVPKPVIVDDPDGSLAHNEVMASTYRDELEWDFIKRYFPGGDKIEKMVNVLSDKVCSPDLSVDDAVKLGDCTTRLVREFVRGVYAIKAKAAEKPVQVNTQVNVRSDAFPLNRNGFGAQRASRGQRKTVPATTSHEEQAQLSSAPDPSPTSLPGSSAPDTLPVSAP